MKIELIERKFNAAQRKAASKSGAAMPDGSYPIENLQDLKNAIRAIGRAKNPAAVKAHIRKRAKALGASDLIPDEWKSESFASLLYEADGVTERSGSFDAIRQRVQAALDSARAAGEDLDLDGDNDAGYNGDYCWIQDLFPDSVVYSMGGELFQCDYTDDGETAKLDGKPVEVEMSYTVVPDDSGTESDREFPRTLAIETEDLRESAYDASKGELTITVIKPGFPRNSTKLKESRRTLPRYYPAETLKRDHKVFDGSKMFVDHQTEAEAKARPEGSVRDWVGNLGQTWVESDGQVKGKVTVVDPQFKAKLDMLNEKGLLKEMKTSVRIAASVSEGEAEGQEAAVIESIIGSKSVDFVTYAGAGGQVEAMESETEADLELVSEADLRERRPDLVRLIESRARKENNDVKTLELQIKEANEKLAVEKKRADEAVAQLQEAETQSGQVSAKKHQAVLKENAELKQENESLRTGQQKADATGKLEKLLAESKLPKPAQDRLRTRFKDAVSDEDFQEAISEERQYIKGLSGGTKVTGLGRANNGTEITEGVERDPKKDLKESFMRAGLSEKDAELAAAGRH